MKHLSDDELTRELERLDLPIQLSSTQKEKMKKHLFKNEPIKQGFKVNKWLPSIISIVVLFSVVVGVIPLLQNKIETSSGNPSLNSITDPSTPERLTVVPQTVDTFLIDWGADSMDRGNHDFDTAYHSKLVVTQDINELKRGQVIYYHTLPVQLKNKDATIPDMDIGRVVGLPGETVEIKNGQVYIDNQLLDTFYGKATMHGLGEEEYFKAVDSIVIEDEQGTRDYFNTNMDDVTVQENTVFVLVDQWWRGIDSRDYGTLPIEQIKGIVIGYKE
ncbi:signal peptidase I [Sporosarcina sp. CAU 1771]